MEGPPMQLYVNGANHWRSENEWPLARTQWKELFLGGPSDGLEGWLRDTPGKGSQRSYNYDPHKMESIYGRPCVVYRSEPFERATKITGPLALYLHAASTTTDNDFYVHIYDEAPDGKVDIIWKEALHASHRELDASRSRPWQPYHPHTKQELLVPGEKYEFAIEIWPTRKVLQPGHRIRLEISGSDNLFGAVGPVISTPDVPLPANVNTVFEGRSHPSRLLVPIIPE